MSYHYGLASYAIGCLFFYQASRLYSSLSRSSRLHTTPHFVMIIIFGVADIAFFHFFKVVYLLHEFGWILEGDYVLTVVETFFEPVLLRFQLMRVGIYSFYRYFLTLRPTYTIANSHTIRNMMMFTSFVIPPLSFLFEGYIDQSQHSHSIWETFALFFRKIKEGPPVTDNSVINKGVVHFIMCTLFLLSLTDLLYYVIYRPSNKNSKAIEKTATETLIASLSILSMHFLYSVTMMGMDWMIPCLPFIRDAICLIPFFATWYSNPILMQGIFNRTYLFFGRKTTENDYELSNIRQTGGRGQLPTISMDTVQIEFNGMDQANRR